MFVIVLGLQQETNHYMNQNLSLRWFNDIEKISCYSQHISQNTTKLIISRCLSEIVTINPQD